MPPSDDGLVGASLTDVEYLVRGGARLSVAVSDRQAERLLAALDAMLAENGQTNLTAIRERHPAMEAHLLDSIAVFRVWQAGDAARCLDVGSGGGFPGLALAAMAPSLELVLLDAAQRKSAACRRIIERLAWGRVAVCHERAETAGQGTARETFDLVVVRAVAALPVVAELCLPLVRTGGLAVAWKGPAVEQGGELADGRRAARALGGEVVRVDSFALPWSGARRTLVCLQKRQQTPARYPRRPGMPGKRPLGVGAIRKD